MHVCVSKDICNNIYSNYREVLYNTVNFSSRQKLETNSLRNNENMSAK